MSGSRLISRLEVDEAIAPVNTTGAGQDGDWVKFTGQRMLIIVQAGAWAGGAAALTLQQATDNGGTGAKALAFTRRWTKTATGTPGSAAAKLAETAVVSSTFDVDTARQVHVIEVDADRLDVNGGFSHLRVRTATPGANADLLSALYLQGDLRYAGDPDTHQDPKE